MRTRMLPWAGLLLAVGALAQPSPRQTITGAQRAATIDSCAQALLEIYVFPDKAQAVASLWRENLAAGRYDGLGDAAAFFQRLSDDGRGVTHDLHFGIATGRPPAQEGAGAPGPDVGGLRDHYGWRRVEVLPGNVGYVDLRCFSDAESAGPVAMAAMQFLSGVDALVIDVRNNGGGSPAMIQLISSYLLPPETWLNSFHIRKGDSWQQFWTLPWVPGPTLRDTPLYVLCSGGTFSAAEEFCYNLRCLGRATLVGERTGGGAHPVQDHLFDLGQGLWAHLRLPFGRAVNPVTQTNWEGVGVEPHLAVPAAAALDRALLDYFDKAAEQADEATARRLGWERAAIQARLAPVLLSPGDLKLYVGNYGSRRIRLEQTGLFYQRESRPPLALTPLGADLFATPLDYFRLRFERDEAGRIIALTGLYDDGREDQNARD